jgi:hypothetical protein
MRPRIPQRWIKPERATLTIENTLLAIDKSPPDMIKCAVVSRLRIIIGDSLGQIWLRRLYFAIETPIRPQPGGRYR